MCESQFDYRKQLEDFIIAGSREAASPRHRASEVSPDELRHPRPQVVWRASGEGRASGYVVGETGLQRERGCHNQTGITSEEARCITGAARVHHSSTHFTEIQPCEWRAAAPRLIPTCGLVNLLNAGRWCRSSHVRIKTLGNVFTHLNLASRNLNIYNRFNFTGDLVYLSAFFKGSICKTFHPVETKWLTANWSYRLLVSYVSRALRVNRVKSSSLAPHDALFNAVKSVSDSRDVCRIPANRLTKCWFKRANVSISSGLVSLTTSLARVVREHSCMSDCLKK